MSYSSFRFCGKSKRQKTAKALLETSLRQGPFENIVEKGENAYNQNSVFFSAMFSTLSKRKNIILITFYLSSANAFSLDKSTIFVEWLRDIPSYVGRSPL